MNNITNADNQFPNTCMQIKAANVTRKCAFGGAGRNRTDDPLLAKQVLSQLSYSPILNRKSLLLIPCA